MVFKLIVKNLEKGIKDNYSNIKKVDVDIDCKLKYMKLNGLFLSSLIL